MTTPTTNPKRVIRDWWRQQLEGKEEIDLDALTDAALAELRKDSGFLDAVLDTVVRDIVRDTGSRVIAKRPGMVATNGHRHVTRAVLIAEIEAEIAERPLAFLQEQDRAGRPRNLLDMTYEQVIAAAQDRYDAGRDNLRRAALYKMLAEEMQTGQRVRDRWTDEEIARMYDQVDIKFGYRRVEALAAGEDR